MPTPGSATARKPFSLLARGLLLLAAILSPWPFGSVTPMARAVLTAGLIALYAAYASRRLSRSGKWSSPPGLVPLSCGLFVAFGQWIPVPPAVVSLATPAVASAYAPLATELGSTEWPALSVERFATLEAALLLLALACAFALSNRLFARPSPSQSLVVYALATVGVALSLFAVYQKTRFGTLLYGRFQVESATPFGPFVNHNHFAGYVEACLLLTLGAAMGRWKRNGSAALLLAGSAALMGIGHLLSHSRGGLLALGAGLATLVWLSRGVGVKGRGMLLAGGGAAVVSFLFLFAPTTLYQRIATIGEPGSDDSVQYRLRLWSDSLELWTRSPVLGSGLGTYGAAIPPYRSGPDETRAEYAESDWIQLLSETGAAGVAVTAIFLLSVAGAARRKLRGERSETARGIELGAIAATVALMVHGLVDFYLHIPSNALLFAVVLGMAAPPGPEHRLPLSRPWRTAIAALALGLGAALALLSLRLGASDALNRRVNPLLTEPEEFTDLIQELVQSREDVPANPESWFLLGRLYNEEAYRARDAARYRELRLEQARSAFRESLRRAPARGRFWFELAWTEASLRHDSVAERLFHLALEREPHWANLRANYALFLVSRGRIDDALAQIETGRRLEPGLSPDDALNIIGPYLGDDAVALRRAAGDDADGERALLSFRKAGQP